MTRLPIAALSAATLLACARDPGPSTDEHGLVFFWQVTSSDIAWGQQCSDSDEFRGELGPIPFDADTYVVYRVSDDGTEAYDQLCETTDSSTCADGDVVFEIDDHTLTYDPDGERSPIENGGACMLDADERWILTDEGATLSFQTDILFTLAGPSSDCEPIQEDLESGAPNGLGIDGCLVTLSATADFTSAD